MLAAQGAETPEPVAVFRALHAESWEFDLTENPLFATHVGDHRFNDRLPSLTLADIERRAKQRRDYLRRLDAVSRERLPADERVNYDIFRRTLDESLREFEFGGHLLAITNRSGFHIEFPELRRTVPLRTVRDYEGYLARLRAFRTYAQQHIALLREGLRRGLVLPAIVLEGVQESIAPHVVDDPAKSLLFEPFRDGRFPESFPAHERLRLADEGRRAIGDSVVPGYREFGDFLRTEYVPGCRGTTGCDALPNGREYYRFLVQQFTTLDLTPEQVHATGLAEVKRIRAEMLDTLRRAKFDGDLAGFIAHLRSDPQFYARTPDQLMKEVAYVLKRMDGELPRLFGTLPRAPYGIREIPAYIAPRTTSAYYELPPGDGSRAGTYYVNTYDLKSRPLYEMQALSLHEAVPGHHLQLALQQELTGLPPFRRFSNFTAYIEGWALYAERLGLECGFYEDPYSDFGRLSFEMWRACRLVVDTGLHYLGWTRKQAIDFMQEHTALALHNITAEVDRYISWPGQALAYKIGELKIRELRKQAETALGERFDIRAFHDVVLRSGSVPLTVLADNVATHIAERRNE